MAEKKVKSFLTSEEIFDLGMKLQKLGLFVIDTRHLIQAHHVQDVLVALQVAGEKLTIDRLKTILAPIFCGTPEQQILFYDFFEDWIKRQPQIIQRFDFAITETAPEIPIRQKVKQWVEKPKRRWLSVSAFVLALAIVITLLIIFIRRPPPVSVQSMQIIGKVIDWGNKTPVSNVQLLWRKDTLKTDEEGCFPLTITDQDSTAPLNIEHPHYFRRSFVINFQRTQDTLSFNDTLAFSILKIKGTQTLSIQVLTQENRQPLPGVSVVFLSQQVSTNRQGRFRFPYQPKDSTVQIIFRHPDYLDEMISYRIHGYDRCNIKIFLRPKPTPKITKADSLKALVARINAFAASQANQPKLRPWQKFMHQHFVWLRLGSFALPLIIFIGWLIVRWFRRRIILERLSTTRERRTESVMVKGKADYLYRNAVFRRMVQRYRLHREQPSADLDVPATVEETIRQGGLFFPRYAFCNVLPEYLALIDRASFSDQHAIMLDSLIQRMRSDGVIVDRYFFDDDPRICQSDRSEMPFMTLKELLALHPQHRLLIFSNADHFIDVRTGKPQAYLEQFLAGSDPAIFIPDKSKGAEYLELTLQDMGFHIGPANLNGLIRHIDALHFPMATEQVTWERKQYFPELLQDRPDIWLERQPPDAAQIDELIQQLEIYLGADSMDWLCACAVYPELHWELTLYLATRLYLADDAFPSDTQQEKLQCQLLDLTRLPWFRYGTMPDWLRLRLITELTPRQHQAVRRELRILLESARQVATDGFKLKFVRRTPADPLADLATQLSLKLGFYRDESPLRDYIFSNYISTGKSGLLSVPIPEKVRRYFFHRGQAILGVVPAAIFVVVFFFVMINWLGISILKSTIPQSHMIPTFHIVEKSTETGITINVASSDTTIGYYINDFLNYQKRIDVTQNFSDLLTTYLDTLKNILQEKVGLIYPRYQFYADLPTRGFGFEHRFPSLYPLSDANLLIVESLPLFNKVKAQFDSLLFWSIIDSLLRGEKTIAEVDTASLSTVNNYLIASSSLKNRSLGVFRPIPETVEVADVKVMIKKYDFYCQEYSWNKKYCNPKGAGYNNVFKLSANSLLVYDKASGLTWQQGGSEKYLYLNQTQTYIDSLNLISFAGYGDWRLPTLEEAMSLMERNKNKAGQYISDFFDSRQRWIWTADPYAGASRRWVVDFLLGNCEPSDIFHSLYIRAVRFGQWNETLPPQVKVKGMTLVLIPGGTFDMGDTFGDGDDDEKPVHSVTVPDFYMGQTEVTNAQYAIFLNAYGKGKDDQGNTMIYEHDWGLRKSGNRWQPQSGYENHPVVRVTWYGAGQFAKWAGCRLQTEAEWEYAAREGGKKIKWSGTNNQNSLGEFAWYSSNSSSKTHPVGTKKSNALGLYDMSGNVWEWCSDWYDENYYKSSPQNNPKGPSSSPIGARLLRGGSWNDDERDCRLSFRVRLIPVKRYSVFGFRVVQDSPQ